MMRNFEKIKQRLRNDGIGSMIKRKFGKFGVNLKRNGFRYSIVRFVSSILFLREKDDFRDAKKKVMQSIIEKHDHFVAYGPFKGMKLNSNVWWGRYDVITKTLGVYEEHILERLCGYTKLSDGPFVDIGAADGYFAIGMAVGGHTKQVYAYEISSTGRENLLENCKANNCEDRVVINGEANFGSLEKLIKEHGNAVILVDIEGAEYDLLDADVLELLKDCHVVIELHPFLVEGGHEKEDALSERAKHVFNVSFDQRVSYSPNSFRELDEFSDEERLVAFSEGRPNNMRWLVLEPK